MKKLPLVFQYVLLGLVGLGPSLLWAAPPNVVLSRALHFSSPDGTSVTLSPGKYLIDQAGPSALRLTPEGDKPGVTIQAKSLTHEQYELFSPMAFTRPQKNEEFLIELLLPGGIRLEARGSTKAPIEPPQPVQAKEQPPLPPSPSPSEIPLQPLQEPHAAVSTPSSSAMLPAQTIQEENPSPVPSHEELLKPDEPLLYHPPDLSSQNSRIVVDKNEPGKEPFYFAVLSPNHTGLTMFEQPSLFWFIAQPASQPVDVLITEEGTMQRLLDVRLLPPIRPGIHKVDLKDYGVRLLPDVTYQWKIILQGNPPEGSRVTSGWIMRIAPPSNFPVLSQLINITTSPPQDFLQAGLWYDGLWALSELIQANPSDSSHLAQRAVLLEQAGLGPPAVLDRSHTAKQ